jgi:hypothetical protein
MDISLGEPLPVYVPLSEAGRDRLQPFVAQMKDRAADAYGPMAGAYGKAGGHALRLALVLEFLWWAIASRDADTSDERCNRTSSELLHPDGSKSARRGVNSSRRPKSDGSCALSAKASANVFQRIHRTV